MKKFFILFFIGILVSLLTCCRRHPYYELDKVEAGSLHILFDWNGYVDIPPGMNLMFYPISDDQSKATDYSGSPILHQLQYDGGVVSLPTGRYNVAIYNDYTYQIMYRGMDDFHTAEAWLEDYDRLPLSKQSGNGHNVAEPDIFYIAQLTDLYVTSQDNNRTITVYPELKTLRLFVHVEIDGIENVSMADGSISGVAGSQMLATGEAPTSTACTRIFSFAVMEHELYVETKAFLLPNRMTDCIYTLQLAFLLRNNSVSTGKYSYDVSDQIIPVLQAHKGHIPPEGIHIYLRNVAVDEVGTGGGFDAVIDGWGNEENIELN